MTDTKPGTFAGDAHPGGHLLQQIRTLDTNTLMTAIGDISEAVKRAKVARDLLKLVESKAETDVLEARLAYYQTLERLQLLTGQRALTAELTGVPVTTIRHARDYLRLWRRRQRQPTPPVTDSPSTTTFNHGASTDTTMAGSPSSVTVIDGAGK